MTDGLVLGSKEFVNEVFIQHREKFGAQRKDGARKIRGVPLEVDKGTLQHRRFANVFGVGDVNGTPRGKTAATVKKSAPLVAHNLVRVIAGQAPDQQFDGYTSCPLITREGSAMLIEFDYEGRLTPSLPAIEPLQESYLAWLMKTRMLKPAYISVLRGRV